MACDIQHHIYDHCNSLRGGDLRAFTSRPLLAKLSINIESVYGEIIHSIYAFLYIPRNKPLYDKVSKYWNDQSFRHNYKNHSAALFFRHNQCITT